MKTLCISFVAILAGTAAMAEGELHPLCDAMGDFTVTAFEARAEGLSKEDAMAMAKNSGDADLDEALTSVVAAAYEMEISSVESEAESQLVEFTAEIMLACQEGIDES